MCFEFLSCEMSHVNQLTLSIPGYRGAIFLRRFRFYIHSGCLDSKKFLSTIDEPPRIPEVPKNFNSFFANKSVEFLC